MDKELSLRERILEKIRRLFAQQAEERPVPAPPRPAAPPLPVPLPVPPGPPLSPPPSPGPMPNRSNLVERDYAFVEAAYRKYVGKVGRNGYLLFNYQNARIASDGRHGMLRHPLDAVYNLPATLEELQRLVAWGRSLDKRPWKADGYDCDDRAIHLKAMLSYHLEVNIGLVLDYGVAHIFNIAMTADGVLYLVEPEDGTIYPIEAQKYPMLIGSIWH